MNYRLEELSEDDFEKLVNTICQSILGTGVISFTKGKDGGRDGKFTGTANNFPSKTGNWSGKFIIQAKHTTNPIASCSDSDFKTIIGKEIISIKKLIAAGEVDNYILFTNRKFTGITGTSLVKQIKTETGLSNVEIIGKETINDSYLSGNKDIVKLYGLDKFSLPFSFSEDELKDLIVDFKSQMDTIEDEIAKGVAKVKFDYKKLDISEKNKKNILGQTYFEDVILSESLEHFDKIDVFLQNPRNSDLKDYYYDIADELRQIITVKREDFGAFEEILVFIRQLTTEGSTKLKGKKRFVSVFLHYMYYTCSIGTK
ncbi:restriction endonuclease [Flagellimonas hymeniacidonis]|uniref:Restriction endonuclease n=1 Tax=Flagellimonas hymeniacidonis TaxID=2603628 RepID=A0A5C8V408_9FLAO|nr:ABC-three component system protein [Flagellimonas hymeniacidonis]TXN35715.1 restriction endonuclease [Flagellimonas hymeniacidonis]